MTHINIIYKKMYLGLQKLCIAKLLGFAYYCVYNASV